MAFGFHDLTPFKGQVATIKRPVEIADFSFDGEHICHPLSTQSLRYYYPPFISAPGVPPPMDMHLSNGLDKFMQRDDSADLHLDGILRTLAEYEKRQNDILHVDFVTWRGMMTKILTAPFDPFGDFAMIATRFQNTIYIEEDHAAKAGQQIPNRRPPPIPQAEMQYWGYKFETLSTLPRPWAECTRDEIENRPSEIVDNHAQYCSIVRTAMGGNSIIIGGEVDAVEGHKPDDPQDGIPYIELKTSQDFHPNDQRRAATFEKKLCRFWAQSFLLGVPKIVVGFRSATGELQRIEDWETMRIPSHVKRRGASWDGNICINFAAKFLDFLKQEVTGEGTWQIRREERASAISVKKTSDQYPPGLLERTFREHREAFNA